MAIDETFVDVDMRRVTDVQDALDTLFHLDSKDDKNKHILLDLEAKDCEEIFKRQKNDSRRVKFHYLMIGLVSARLCLPIYIICLIYCSYNSPAAWKRKKTNRDRFTDRFRRYICLQVKLQ